MPTVCMLPNIDELGLVTDGLCLLGHQFIYEPPVGIFSFQLHDTNEVGYLTYMNRYGSLLNARVGRYCSIAEGVFIGPWEHPTDRISTHPFVFNAFAPKDTASDFSFEKFEIYPRIVDRQNVIPSTKAPQTVVGNDVWIGRNVTILQGVTVGHGAVIGAHSVVTKDVEPYSIVAGLPARTIRKRFDEKTISRLLALQWWDYDLASARERLPYDNIEAFIQLLSGMIDRDEVALLDVMKVVMSNVEGECKAGQFGSAEDPGSTQQPLECTV